MSTRQVRRIAIERRSAIFPSDYHSCTIDIFEHRLNPREGYTIDDMVDVVLGSPIFETVRGDTSLALHSNSDWSQEGSDHPIGLFEPGAIQVIPNVIDVESELIVLDGEHVELPDGSKVNIKGLFPASVTMPHRRSSQGDANRLRDTFVNCRFNQILLGAILETLPLPYSDDAHKNPAFEDIARIAGRLSTLLDLGFAAGMQGRDRAMSDAMDLCRNMFTGWWLRPDRMRHPENLQASTELSKIIKDCDPELVELGHKTLRGLPPTLAEVALEAIKLGDDESASNHKRIALKPALKDFDTLIEDHAPIDLLKPAALKRRQKRLKLQKEPA
jgi:hypothetical protein